MVIGGESQRRSDGNEEVGITPIYAAWAER